MAIEWDEVVETKRKVRLALLKPGAGATGQVCDATVDDLRRACEAAGLVVADTEAETSTEQARAVLNAVPGEDIVSAARRTMASLARSVEKGESLRYGLSTIVAEVFGPQPVMTHEELVSFLDVKIRERTRNTAAHLARAEKAQAERDEARKDYHAAVDRALDAHRVLGARHNEGTIDAAKRVVAERDDLRARLEKAERMHSEAEAQVECRNALRYRIASLEADLAAAKSEAAEAVENCDKATERLDKVLDEVRGLKVQLTAARARIAELEAPLPEATVEELVLLGEEAMNRLRGLAPYVTKEAKAAAVSAIVLRLQRDRAIPLVRYELDAEEERLRDAVVEAAERHADAIERAVSLLRDAEVGDQKAVSACRREREASSAMRTAVRALRAHRGKVGR